MKKLVIIPALLAGLLLQSCQREAEDYISIKGKIFIFNIKVARAFYVLTLDRLPATPDDAVVTAEFENPAGGPPLVKEQKVFPKMTQIDLQSPDVNCVVSGRPYKIKITLRNTDGEELQTIETELSSTLDQTAMPEKALVLGAFYDRNPEAFNPDGSIKFRKKCG